MTDDSVLASPSKDFFVSMLTRDIELQDAILDLLDNCLDGIHRQTRTHQNNSAMPYQNYFARITLNAHEFSIEDNCGGIPDGIARTSAFRMGRPTTPRVIQEVSGTIGMYGIGMKRAIFKMGRRASVRSRTATDGFVVSIEPAWLDDSDEWHLPYQSNRESMPEPGTTITITELHSDVAGQFNSDDSDFPELLKIHISESYSLILSKGFEVTVNGTPIHPQQFVFLDSKAYRNSGDSRSSTIRPYILQGSIQSVDVAIYAGFYRKPPNDEELDAELSIKSSSDNAGWTIACNDRIVVFRDKSRLTGWGEATVPSYHNQFINFAGVVMLKADDTSRLPLTTTKRGLDTSSDLFLQVKNFMREATSTFTQFTNRWKSWPQEREEVFRDASPVQLNTLRRQYSPDASSELRAVRNHSNLKRLLPTLPIPSEGRSELPRTISFKRSSKEIDAVSEFLFGEEKRTPSEVGMAAFDRTLRQSQGEKG
jgi:hypothetical protein